MISRARHVLRKILRRLAVRSETRRNQRPAPTARGVCYERDAPTAWPERPAILPEVLAALGPPRAGDKIAIDAQWLLTPYRFDIPAKYLYAKHREKNVACGFARELYADHLKVWNDFHEFEPVKRGLDAYLETFHAILDSTKDEGFDADKSLVPLGRSLSPVNGSHRVAACLVYGKDVSCRVANEALESHNYNYLYFRNREVNVPGGLTSASQNAIALEYCRLKPQTYAALVFPSAVGKHRQIMDILLAHGYLVYEKEFYLNPRGQLNLIRCIYAGERWLGTSKDDYKGSRSKMGYCFAKPGPLRLFLFETYESESAVRAKSAIRDLFGLANHSVHINDSHEETLRVAEALLNANGVHHLENAVPEVPSSLLKHIEQLKEWLRRSDLAAEDVCIGGSAVLAAYGLREGKDLDFLHHGPLSTGALPANLGTHNEYAELYGLPPDDLIFDPANHFYYEGLKFVSLPICARMKRTRGERKDAADLSLMERIL